MAHFVISYIISLGARISSRVTLALAHAHGWRPERQITDFLMTAKARVGSMIWRLLRRAPVVPDAPGLTWKRRKKDWVAIWRAQPGAIKSGFRPKDRRLWIGTTPSSVQRQFIADQCVVLQHEMREFSRWGSA